MLFCAKAGATTEKLNTSRSTNKDAAFASF
jgi:hypothetical protein